MTVAMPYAHLGEALATDYLLVREQFSDEQWERFIATRRFVDTEVLPAINGLLGGNGILLENHVIRHMTDIEVLHTYEGTETIQTLIVGRDITGVAAFA